MGNVESSERVEANGDSVPDVEEDNLSVTSLLLQLPGERCIQLPLFLSPVEWQATSCASRSSNSACQSVFSRVRMHGFRCATEVASAWAIGEKADAKELAALYLKAGVPIYPPCSGHACNTILWRMKVEKKATTSNSADDTAGNSNVLNGARILDRFDDERDAVRERTRMQRNLQPNGNINLNFAEWALPIERSQSSNLHQEHDTYLDEKAAFSYSSLSTDRHHQNTLQTSITRSGLFARDYTSSKRSMRCHSHLVREHLKQCPSVLYQIERDLSNGNHANPFGDIDDPIEIFDRNMVTMQNCFPRAVSLSIDFYNPVDEGLVDDWIFRRQTPVFQSQEIASLPPPQSEESHSQLGQEHDSNAPPLSPGRRALPHSIARNSPILQSPSMQSTSVDASTDSLTSLKNVRVQTYSSYRGISTSLRLVFEKHRKRINQASTDAEFQYLLHEFWDEVFPSSKGIAYHDGHTPVPRLDSLETFLTTPCPKHIGIVQCEIERIKVGKKNVKGRFFPTYEYNLFIRDSSAASAGDGQREVPQSNKQQRHVILMHAKNRGRNYYGNADQGFLVEEPEPSLSPDVIRHVAKADKMKPKRNRGVNNYFIYMATSDSNPWRSTSEKEFPVKPVELGRLQNNYFGTEFQIFTPRKSKLFLDPSGNESATNASRPINAIDASAGSHLAPAIERTEGASNISRGITKNAEKVRHGSWPLLKIPPRPNRRAIAQDEQPTQSSFEDVDALCSSLCHLDREMENGVITYTANLLGNRPRVMDVCIPNPQPAERGYCDDQEYLSCCQWEMYCQRMLRGGQYGPLEGNNLMLTRFRRLQEHLNRRAHTEENFLANESNVVNEDDFGLVALQNRPPWWNADLGAFVLNFGGRVSVASVKNFQLCDRNDHDYIMLQFGRIQGRHSFTMDFQYPLTAVQAFAIAISSLQSKISLG